MYAKILDERPELFQWDTGQYMEVSDDVDRIDFQFRDTRKMVYGVFAEDGKVVIPDILLQDSGILDCLIMVENDGLWTMERMEVPVIERPMPPGYVMTKRGAIVSYDDLDSIIGKFDLMRRTGDTMAGDIDMDSFMITNLNDAEQPGDAVSKHFADSEYVKLTGSRMKGRITGLQQPIADDEPVTKMYMDQEISSSAAATDAGGKAYTDGKFWNGSATIAKANWAGTKEPYTCEVSVPGMPAAGTLYVDAVMSDTWATAEKQVEGYGYIYKAKLGDNKITFYATDKPEEDIPIQIAKAGG